jgi:uncharacterized membrane protein
MDQSVEWISLAIRWFHVMAGITWIGNSFFFMWLDGHLRPPKDATKSRVDGELWMVHSGGFYQVEKSRIAPGRVPDPLYWFKWETTATLITGLFLLISTYYTQGGIYLLKADGSGLPWGAAVGVSLSILVGCWLIYDTLWNSEIAQRRPEIGHAMTILILTTMVWLYCYFLGGRAAFVHIGATMGTVMTANVWRRILPGQKKMIDAARNGMEPDFSQGKKAKHRSIHNSYMTLPVVLMMVSNHYPHLYSNQFNWITALTIFVVGAALRHFMLARHEGKQTMFPLMIAAVAFAATIWLTSFPVAAKNPRDHTSSDTLSPVTTQRALEISRNRCVPCHSSTPSEPGIAQAPLGIYLETEEQMIRFHARIRERSVVTETMPPANKTAMTSEERRELASWAAGIDRLDPKPTTQSN